MRSADAQWLAQAVHSGLSSGEGLVECVRDAEMSLSNMKVVASGGATEKRLLAIETELAKPLKAMGRKDSILSAILRQAWDGDKLEVLNRKENALQATDAHVSIIAHCTTDSCAKKFKLFGIAYAGWRYTQRIGENGGGCGPWS